MWRAEYGSDYMEFNNYVLSCCYSVRFRAISNIFLDFYSFLSTSAELSHYTSLIIPGDSQFNSEAEIGIYSGGSLKNSGTLSLIKLIGKLN